MAKRVVILGGGVAGLSAAYHLLGDCDLVERNPYLGGHCHTKNVDGFLFDEGAHVFYGQGEASERLFWKPLKDEILHFEAEIWNNYGGISIGRYPVQANLHALPPDLITRCLVDFIAASQKQDPTVSHYDEWCRHSFGDAMAEEFLLRYARKLWTVDPATLNLDWLPSRFGGRIARPSLAETLRGAVDARPQSINYLTKFAYPSSGGFVRIIDEMSKRVDRSRVRLGASVAAIDPGNHRLTLSDGQTVEYDVLVSSLPLPDFIRLTEAPPKDILAAAARLSWNSVRVVNFGIQRPEIGPGHWMYFYDTDVPFFRISFPSKYAPANAPKGCSSVACEITYAPWKPLPEEDLFDRCQRHLVDAGILTPDDRVLVREQIDIPYGYVIFDEHRTPALSMLHSWMSSHDVVACGRYGDWGYHSSFEAIESGVRAAQTCGERYGLTVAV